MNSFNYVNPVKVYFGQNTAASAFAEELPKYGKNVMLAYGGGSVKKNGIYEQLTDLLEKSGKVITDFSDITPNPTYAKVQEGAAIAREKKIGRAHV